MPRTRTKFIWPPPNLARDSATNTATPPPPPPPPSGATTTAEPRAKKPKLDNNNNDDDDDGNNTTNRNAASPALSDTRREETTWDPTSNVVPPSFEDVIAAYAQIPMDTQIKRYQDWRRHGSVHDDYCMMCQRARPQNLVPCYTCRRSFHDECMPPGSLYNDKRQWYCTVCVRRNWHVEPPTVTPPESPRLTPATATQHHVLPSTTNEDNRSTNRHRSSTTPTNETSAAEDSQALSILAEISRSISRDVSSSSHPLRMTTTTMTATALNSTARNSSPYTPSPSAPKSAPRLGSHPASSRRNDQRITSPSATATGTATGTGTGTTQSFSMLDSHARKSRFATLSSEVDSALWVLYRELESATSLRQRISELEAEVVKLRQDVNIRDNQIILSQRSAPAVNISQADVDRLRAQAAKGEAAVQELERLRANNELLEKELRDARAECASKDETLNDWKGRLASLIGP